MLHIALGLHANNIDCLACHTKPHHYSAAYELRFRRRLARRQSTTPTPGALHASQSDILISSNIPANLISRLREMRAVARQQHGRRRPHEDTLASNGRADRDGTIPARAAGSASGNAP